MPEFGFATSLGGDDEVGIWQALPAATARGLELESVDAGPVTGTEEISLWQVMLPRDRRAATETLAMAEHRLAAAESALPHAARRLSAFVAAGGPALELAPAVATPEIALYDWVAASDAGRDLPAERGSLEQVAAFFDKVHDAVRSYSAIETELGGARVGLTLVSWTGDFRTAFPRGLALDDAQQHTAAVALALRTRDAWLRLSLTVAAGAVQLAALLSLNPALALPAAYRFVRQIIDQVQALGELPAPGQETQRRYMYAGE